MAATGASPVNRKPLTDWSVLAGPIKTNGQKGRRIFGKFLTFLTLPSLGSVYYVYHYMTGTPERVLAAYNGTRIFTVATFVTGVAFWYFNSLGDLPERLKTERKNLEQKIRTVPLAKIRDTHLLAVFSNSELNEWMRYLLKEQGYEQFMKLQTETIFELELENASLDLLKEKYREYLKTPCPAGMLALNNQKAFDRLVDVNERLKARELTAEKEAENAKTYQAFIDRNGISAINYVKNDDLKKQLFSKFLEHIRQKNLGLIETRKQFAEDIKAFGKDAQHVVELEIEKLELLSGKSYQEFRDRNGYDQIQQRTVGNTKNLAAFKEKFLELPYSLQDRKEYEKDRNLLNITDDDIKKAMTARWLSKRYSEILKTERDDFLACMKAEKLNPKDIWTTKAILETANLTIQVILKDYADLFVAGVLNANDGNLKARAAKETTDLSLTQLIDNYGDGIFTYGLLDPAIVQRLIGDFVANQASFYLGINTKSTRSSYIDRISRLELASPLATEITQGKSQVAQAKTEHEKQQEQINLRFDRRIKELDEDLPIRTKAESEAVTAAEEKLQQAERAAKTHNEKIAGIQTLLASYQAQINSANEQIELKSATREALLEEQLNIQIVPDVSDYERKLQIAQQDYKAAEAIMNNDPQAALIRARIAGLNFEAVQLESQLAELRNLKAEHDGLKTEVESETFKTRRQALQISIDTPIPTTIKGVAAAREAASRKEMAAKNLSELEGMKAKEKRLEELNTQLKDRNIGLLAGKAGIIRKQIPELEVLLQKHMESLAATAHLPIRRTAIQQLTRTIEIYKAKQQRLEQISINLETLKTEIKALKSSRDDAIMKRGMQEAELAIAERNSQEPLLARTTAQQALATAQQALKSKTATVKADIEQLKQQRETERSAAIEAEDSSYQATLLQLIQQFQGTILTKANPPPPSFG